MTLLDHLSSTSHSCVYHPLGTVLDCGQTLATDKSTCSLTGKMEWKSYLPLFWLTEVHASHSGEREQFQIVLKLYSSIPLLSAWNMSPVTFLSCIAWANSSFGGSSSKMFNYLVPIGLKIKMAHAGSRKHKVDKGSWRCAPGGRLMRWDIAKAQRRRHILSSCPSCGTADCISKQLAASMYPVHTHWHCDIDLVTEQGGLSSLPLHFGSPCDSAQRSPDELCQPQRPKRNRIL